MTPRLRKISFITFGLLALLSFYGIFQIKFSFDFEQFFPQGDPDLEFFQEFIEDFETDDNFLIVAVERKDGVFEQKFLEDFHDLTVKIKGIPYITESQSITKFEYPIKTPFGMTTVPAIHIDKPERYKADKGKILQDERFVYNLISKDATTLAIFTRTETGMMLEESRDMMAGMDSLMATYSFDDYHYLGRSYFTEELVEMQFREILVSGIVSLFLVGLIMFYIFRRIRGIIIAISSVGLGMLIFMGLMGLWGRELSMMSALYPVLMIIVGTSDVIHIMSKYIDELRKGEDRTTAINTTIREIGMATLLTSVTTAIGFLSLVSSRVVPIREFGINSAIGVLVAYVTVVCFTTALISMYDVDSLMKIGRGQKFWDKSMNWAYNFTKKFPGRIAISAIAITALSFYGISKITTNYTIVHNLPIGAKITEDFLFFEKNFTGFRPLEFAVTVKEGHKATDYEVVKEIEKIENYLRENYPAVRAIASITTLYKSINQAFNRGKTEEYKLPDTEAQFKNQKRFADKIPESSGGLAIMVSKDKQKARITSRVLDMGADDLALAGDEMDAWISANTSLIDVKRTGTGLIVDKNSVYVRESLMYGLAMAIAIVSILMGLLFKNVPMLFISLVPNIFPLLLAGALLGFLGIDLEAGVSIIFAVIFGIAVDDTIHFLSKYKLARNKGKSIDDSLHVTFVETGKAIVLTTLILFFGFLIMLFSVHPPSVTVGLLVSLTLFTALIADLMLIPILVRWFMKEKE
ncbi:MAG: putative RND superfamily exporter protein [Saprospiraceae bacterium]|jgi:predicted RND superfamily exporter protein